VSGAGKSSKTNAVDRATKGVDRSTRRDDRAEERVDRSTGSVEGSAGRVDRAAAAVARPRRSVDDSPIPMDGQPPSSGTSIPKKTKTRRICTASALRPNGGDGL
jgi:hypothetical protein